MIEILWTINLCVTETQSWLLFLGVNKFFFSLVRLALSSNFPGGLLSAAQSYPSLAPNAQNALTLSLTSTSSESEQVGIVQ